jgi:hypothetical protein
LLKRPEQGAGKGHSGRAVTDRETPCDSDLEESASQRRPSHPSTFTPKRSAHHSFERGMVRFQRCKLCPV